MKRNIKDFKNFLKNKNAFGMHVKKAIITDEQSMKILGLSNVNIKNNHCENNVYILAPKSVNII